MPKNFFRRQLENLTSSHRQIRSTGLKQKVLVAPIYGSTSPAAELPDRTALLDGVQKFKTYWDQVSHKKVSLDLTLLNPIHMAQPMDFYVNTQRGMRYRRSMMCLQFTRRFWFENSGTIFAPCGMAGAKEFRLNTTTFNSTTFTAPPGYYTVIKRHTDGTLVMGHSRGLTLMSSSGQVEHLNTNNPTHDIAFDDHGHVIVAQGVEGVVAYRKNGLKLTELQRNKFDHPVLALVKHIDVLYAICSENVAILRINRAVGTINQISVMQVDEPICGHVFKNIFYLGTADGIEAFDVSTPQQREAPSPLTSSAQFGFVTAIGNAQDDVIIGTLKNGIIKSPAITAGSRFGFETVVPFSSQDRPELLPAIPAHIVSDGANGFLTLVLGRGLRHYAPNAQGKYTVTKTTPVPRITGIEPESAFMQAVDGLRTWVRDFYSNAPLVLPAQIDGASEVHIGVSDLFHSEVFNKIEAQLDQMDAAKLLVKSYSLVGIISSYLGGQGRGRAQTSANNDLFNVFRAPSIATSVTVSGDDTDLAWPTFAHEMGHVMKLAVPTSDRGPARGLPDLHDDTTSFCLMGSVDGALRDRTSALLLCAPHLMRAGYYASNEVAVVNVSTDLAQPKEFTLVEYGLQSAIEAPDVRVIRVSNNGLEKVIELRSQPADLPGAPPALFDCTVRAAFLKTPGDGSDKFVPHPVYGVFAFSFEDTPKIELVDPRKELPNFQNPNIPEGVKLVLPINPQDTPKPQGHISTNGYFDHSAEWVLIPSLTMNDIGVKVEAKERVSEHPRRYKVVLTRI